MIAHLFLLEFLVWKFVFCVKMNVLISLSQFDKNFFWPEKVTCTLNKKNYRKNCMLSYAESGTVYEQKKNVPKTRKCILKKARKYLILKKRGEWKKCKYTSDNGHTWARTNNNMFVNGRCNSYVIHFPQGILGLL